MYRSHRNPRNAEGAKATARRPDLVASIPRVDLLGLDPVDLFWRVGKLLSGHAAVPRARSLHLRSSMDSEFGTYVRRHPLGAVHAFRFVDFILHVTATPEP